MDEELRNILNSLWHNWVFRLSLSSNELFHSNVLQYIAEAIAEAGADGALAMVAAGEGIEPPPGVISVFAAKQLLLLLGGEDEEGCFAASRALLDACGAQCELTVNREWSKNKIDLAVLLNDNGRPRVLFALEVKVKAYPDGEQLQRHRTSLDETWDGILPAYRAPLFLLTGMGGDLATELGENALSFEDIAQRLGSMALDHVVPGPVLPAYAELCDHLHLLFDILNGNLTENLTWGQAKFFGDLLFPYRMHSIWWKLWASYIAERCKEATQEPDIAVAQLLHFHSGFTRTGSLEACWSWSNDAIGNLEQAIKVGVQIEGKSLRLFLNVVHEELGNRIDSRRRAEAILLTLCSTRGLFVNNQQFQNLIGHWGNAQPPCPTNIALTPIPIDDPQQLDNAVNLFMDDAGVGLNQVHFRPMLPGYANAPGNGHADIRLTLRQTATLGEVVCFVHHVLMNDFFSLPPANPNAGPLLFQIVQGFRDAPDRAVWINNPAA